MLSGAALGSFPRILKSSPENDTLRHLPGANIDTGIDLLGQVVHMALLDQRQGYLRTFSILDIMLNVRLMVFPAREQLKALLS